MHLFICCPRFVYTGRTELPIGSFAAILYTQYLLISFQWYLLGVFHNHNLSNLDSSDQQIHLCCDLNLNPDYEFIDLPLEVDQQIQIAWITHNSLKNNGGNMWQEILTFGKFFLYCDIIILYYCIIIYNNI